MIIKKNHKTVIAIACVLFGISCWIFGDRTDYNFLLVALGWLLIIGGLIIRYWEGDSSINVKKVGDKLVNGTQKMFELILKIIFYSILLIIVWILLSAILTPIVASIGEGTCIIIFLLLMILRNQEIANHK